ncbi:hypothetical protein BDP55DRAFT_31531 [Colletotrichum godetiae]|uniref:Uncharacterized protein n=1 Tax=Colletotrichum godetiae TaxID=1209918 RepID=A0AAJ0EVJ4_9PEZI|nr:uncharacterized protein BDP55DRAFT_31531 [Colletotrichum godetiae]KAK1688824.1 hypothetical protein BDP55DRAFT_31531 [Colletotrichum godetiae]
MFLGAITLLAGFLAIETTKMVSPKLGARCKENVVPTFYVSSLIELTIWDGSGIEAILFLPESLSPLLNFTLRLIIPQATHRYSFECLLSTPYSVVCIQSRCLGHYSYCCLDRLTSIVSSLLLHLAHWTVGDRAHHRVCSPTTLTHTQTHIPSVDGNPIIREGRESLRSVGAQSAAPHPFLLTCLTSAPRLGPFTHPSLVGTHEPLCLFFFSPLCPP